ncbi:hypothetical protein K1T71_000563 [Dendrolimus kikuchii]|uniref:Uncharacterized protein n=1 Tax=Dendrolimus kikuchii TaxID=765133 RepID=A0ACC1DJR3_9NEOP|nr:hypothetical protein K1T71_000563 [Dendrolimus kikuchii]
MHNQWNLLIFQVPTLRKLQVIARTDLDFDCSLEVLRKILKAIGFTHKKCQNNRKALIEQSHIAAKREEYLAIVKKNRDLPEESRKDIIYLDESYIHSSYKVTKCWQSLNIKGFTKDISKGKRYIIVHAGSEKGFVPNCLLIFTGKNKLEDYHSEMNGHNFTKWVKEKLIPNLHEPSIIVMDNAPYHSVVTNKAPTSNSRIDEIKLWLLENNIDFDPTLRKPNLLSLVKKNKPSPIYAIDDLLGEYVHTVVRLPPYHCDLNPIELIWAKLKQKVAARNVESCDVKQLTEEAFNSITPEIWKNCCHHVQTLEKEYYERGHRLYQDIDELIIRLGDDSSSDDSSCCSDDSAADESGNKLFLDIEYLESDDESDERE